MIRGRLRRHRTEGGSGERRAARNPVPGARAGPAERRLQRPRLAAERRADVVAARRRDVAARRAGLAAGDDPGDLDAGDRRRHHGGGRLAGRRLAPLPSAPARRGSRTADARDHRGRRAHGVCRRRRRSTGRRAARRPPLLGQGHDRRLAPGPRRRQRQGRQRPRTTRQRGASDGASAADRRSAAAWQALLARILPGDDRRSASSSCSRTARTISAWGESHMGVPRAGRADDHPADDRVAARLLPRRHDRRGVQRGRRRRSGR